jgi:molecular chaperone GrpE
LSKRKTAGPEGAGEAPLVETDEAGAADAERAPEQAAAEASSESTSLAEALAPPPDAGVVEAYHQRARLAEDRLAEVLAAYRTLKKETEAHRERTSRNLERRFEQRRERLLLKFIDILDNMDRALGAAESTYAGEPLIEGLILVRTQLLQTLKDEGLERIPVLGLPYDPHVSEAVATETVEEPEHHGVVVKEHLRGYKLNGRIARASRVTVGEYPGAAERPSMAALDDTAAVAAAPENDDLETADLSPPPPPPPGSETSAPPAPGADETGETSEPSLEEIVARAEAQEALFPDAFQGDDEDEKEKP